MKKIKKIHFVGIKGVGMAPLTIIAKQAGFNVTGCDVEQEFITDKILNDAKIEPIIGFSSEHLKKIDLVITTGAHKGFLNQEVVDAKNMDIPVWSQGQAVGEFMLGDIFNRKFKGISVAGCHGKTTTTGMIATILQENKLDPSYAIGTSSLPSLGLPGHFGKGEFFVAEADEYATDLMSNKKAKFLWQNPYIAVFTNLDFDHPDVYESIEDLKIAFLKFANQLNKDSILIANGDDKEILDILKNYNGNKLTFGFSKNNDYILKNVIPKDTQTFFWVEAKGQNLGEFVIQSAGAHNAINALGAIAVCNEIGLKKEAIRKGLLGFKGSKRRFEYIGENSLGAKIYDDYAHHPTEIKTSLESFKRIYPKTKIICIFQPHMQSRTKKLFEQFSSSFIGINQAIITDIYSSLREKNDPSFSSRNLVEAVNKISTNAVFLPKLSDVVEYVDKKRFGRDTIIVTMGAGDIYKIGDKLINL